MGFRITFNFVEFFFFEYMHHSKFPSDPFSAHLFIYSFLIIMFIVKKKNHEASFSL